ncbi:MAG: hypothetical protein ACQ9ET_00050 [Nitrosomonadaceae bacterium]
MKLDAQSILMAVLGSLSAFLFYGHIALQDEVDSMNTRLRQAESELDDIWAKYNDEQKSKFDFMEKFHAELDKKKDK